MTLVDKPLAQYAINEARDAGITRFILVTSKGKGTLEYYFYYAPQIRANYAKKVKNRCRF